MYHWKESRAKFVKRQIKCHEGHLIKTIFLFLCVFSGKATVKLHHFAICVFFIKLGGIK